MIKKFIAQNLLFQRLNQEIENLFVAIVTTVVVVSTTSVRKRTGGVLPSVVLALGTVN